MIKEKIAKIILKLTPSKLKAIYEFSTKSSTERKLEFSQLSFSQEGEDMILARIFEAKELGFFVDVGAHHPKRFSNTYIFYKKGWRGINIDPVPTMLDMFSKERPGDINLQIGIGEEIGNLTYFMFNEPALNTFSEEEAMKKDNLRQYKIVEKRKIPIDTLENILDVYLPEGKQIDFLSVDAEGLDLSVLKSNNFIKYKPTVILIEILELKSLELFFESETARFLDEKGYRFFAKTLNTVFFIIK